MKRVGLSIDTGRYVFVTDVIPERLSRVDLVNEVAIAGDDARLRCYGAEKDDAIILEALSQKQTRRLYTGILAS